MDDTALYICLRINCLDCLLKAGKPVNTEEQDVLYPTVFQIIEHLELELGGPVCTGRDAQDVLISIQGDTRDNIGGPAQNTAILPDFIMDAVYKDERVDRIKGAGLPLFDFRQDTVCELADHFCGQFNPI